MSADAAALLPPRLAARLERVQLASGKRLAGLFAGEHRSTRRGASLDFADYREYHPGDDYRRIDYQLYARLDVLLLKLFEAEDDVEVRIVIDASASMATQGKLDMAKRLAAALAFISVIRRDSVRVFVFPGTQRGCEQLGPRVLGRRGIPEMLQHLASVQPHGGTAAAAAVRDVLGQGGPGGINILVSDLLTPEWEQAVSRLPGRGSEVIVAHILGPDDLDIDAVGDVDLVDVETDVRVPVTLEPSTRDAYRASVAKWLDRVASGCRRSGAAYVRMTSTDDLEAQLLGTWRKAGAVR